MVKGPDGFREMAEVWDEKGMLESEDLLGGWLKGSAATEGEDPAEDDALSSGLTEGREECD